MSSCIVYVDSKQYDGEYNYENGCLEVDIYDYSSNGLGFTVDSKVEYKEMIICDLRNKCFFYSPLFFYNGSSYALTHYEKYKTDFYYKTKEYKNIEELNKTTLLSSIRFYHPTLIHHFTNPCLKISGTDKELICQLNLKSDKKVIKIQKNNIEKIELGGDFSYSLKRWGQGINIESENYIELFFINPICCEDVMAYINEFDVLINAYYPTGLHSYKTIICTANDGRFELVHRFLGTERQHKQVARQLVKIDFFEFLEQMYKTTNYRGDTNRNKYLPLSFKKPTGLEELYTYYFRYIDLYMGEYLKEVEGKDTSNYDRISRFIDDNIDLFDSKDIVNLDNFKNELNSLRNHYVHEGYYLPNGKFKVAQKKKTLYYKEMDYGWLIRVTKSLKIGVYRILYTQVLNVEIDEDVLKIVKL